MRAKVENDDEKLRLFFSSSLAFGSRLLTPLLQFTRASATAGSAISATHPALEKERYSLLRSKKTFAFMMLIGFSFPCLVMTSLRIFRIEEEKDRVFPRLIRILDPCSILIRPSSNKKAWRWNFTFSHYVSTHCREFWIRPIKSGFFGAKSLLENTKIINRSSAFCLISNESNWNTCRWWKKFHIHFFSRWYSLVANSLENASNNRGIFSILPFERASRIALG